MRLRDGVTRGNGRCDLALIWSERRKKFLLREFQGNALDALL
jgi:hypothetical protein